MKRALTPSDPRAVLSLMAVVAVVGCGDRSPPPLFPQPPPPTLSEPIGVAAEGGDGLPSAPAPGDAADEGATVPGDDAPDDDPDAQDGEPADATPDGETQPDAEAAGPGKDAAGKDAKGKDATGKDATGKDAKGKDATGKDARGDGTSTKAKTPDGESRKNARTSSKGT